MGRWGNQTRRLKPWANELVVREPGWQTERRCCSLPLSGHLRPWSTAPVVCDLGAARTAAVSSDPLSRQPRSLRTAHGLADTAHSAGTARSPKPQVLVASQTTPVRYLFPFPPAY